MSPPQSTTNGAAPVAEPAPPFEASFARDWPRDPVLIELVAAFDRGDYAHVRSNAPRIAKESNDPKVRAAALDLRRRIDPDPVAGILLLVAIGLLVILAAHFLGHRAPDDAPPPRPLRPTPRST